MFPNFWKPPQNSKLQNGDTGNFPKTELTNIRRHSRKFSRVPATGIFVLQRYWQSKSILTARPYSGE